MDSRFQPQATTMSAGTTTSMAVSVEPVIDSIARCAIPAITESATAYGHFQ